jgi:hypothetical protein
MPNLRQLNLIAAVWMFGLAVSFFLGILCGAFLR